jgi:hypothetical protein
LATLTFNRPEARNAMTWDMYEALVDACDRVDKDPDVRVLILRGAGGKAFVAGTDIRQFESFRSPEDATNYERRIDEVLDRLERVTKATIAQVQGVAAGGVCAIALTCDLRVATPESTFGIPIARTLGNCLSGASYSWLVDLLGPGPVKGILFPGWLLGLGNRVQCSAHAASHEGNDPAHHDTATPAGGRRSRPDHDVLHERGFSRRRRGVSGEAEAGVDGKVNAKMQNAKC